MSDQKPQQPLLSPEEINEILRQTAAARLLDRFGRLILPGCAIEMHNELPAVYTVIDAKPNLNPGMPPGSWTLTVVSQIEVTCLQGRRHNKMTVVALPEMAAPTARDNAAASDAPAAPPSSIILTDMDKTARDTLADAIQGVTAKTGPVLVPPPAAAIQPTAEEERAHAEERGAPFANDDVTGNVMGDK